MTAGLSDSAVETIRGCQDAQRLLYVLQQGLAPSDALLEGFQAVHSLGNTSRLRGFCREIQKRLESAR